MGGFMPTPPAPAQPPQVKLETTATSRGNFNTFLKNLNGATSLNPPSMAPMVGAAAPTLAPTMSNTDIFDVPQQFVSGGLVQFGQDLMRGLAEPVNEKTREIPQFLQVIEDSAKERFGVDLGGSSPMGGFNQFGSQMPDMSMFQPSSPNFQPTQEVGPKDYSMGVARPSYMPMDEDGDGIDQFGAKMPEFEANQGSPMTLGDAKSAFEQGMSELKSSAFGAGGSRIAGIGSIGSLFMEEGGSVPPRNTNIQGQPHMLAYITPEEGGILKALGGAGKPGPMGIPSFAFGDPDAEPDDTQPGGPSESNDDDNGGFQDYTGYEDDPVAGFDFSPDPSAVGGGGFDVVSTTPSTPEEQEMNQKISLGLMKGKGLTNIKNVGPRSNLVYSPQFTADLAVSRGLDPSTKMSPEDFATTTQGQAQAQAAMDDALAMDQAVNQAPAATNIAASSLANLSNISTKDPFGVVESLDLSKATPTGVTAGVSPAPPGFEEQVGKPYSGTPIDQIEAFYNAPTTIDLLGVPPGKVNAALSFIENKARDAVATDLISGKFEPIYDSRGNITGSRNPRTGEVQSGMDMNVTGLDSGDESDDPLTLKKPIDKKEDEGPTVLPPLGGITPDDREKLPTVVKSPFDPSTATFTPVGFDSGDLNKLIEQITGIRSPVQLQDGGLIRAVDDFLATGT